MGIHIKLQPQKLIITFNGLDYLLSCKKELILLKTNIVSIQTINSSHLPKKEIKKIGFSALGYKKGSFKNKNNDSIFYNINRHSLTLQIILKYYPYNKMILSLSHDQCEDILHWFNTK